MLQTSGAGHCGSAEHLVLKGLAITQSFNLNWLEHINIPS